MENSYFDGTVIQQIGYALLVWFISAITLGIAAPWAICMLYAWEKKHTVIEGRRFAFDGTGIGLFGHWIKWLFFTVITLGIYSIWLDINLKKWITANTRFEK